MIDVEYIESGNRVIIPVELLEALEELAEHVRVYELVQHTQAACLRRLSGRYRRRRRPEPCRSVKLSSPSYICRKNTSGKIRRR